MKITHHPPLPRGAPSRLGGVHNAPQVPAQGAVPVQSKPLPQATDVPPELSQAIAAGKTKPIEGY
jgi:hypothetical protein